MRLPSIFRTRAWLPSTIVQTTCNFWTATNYGIMRNFRLASLTQMRTTRLLMTMTLLCQLYGCGQTSDQKSQSSIQKPQSSVQKPQTADQQVQTSTYADVGSDPMEKWSRSCSLCHINGIGGAPRLGDTEDWAARLDQGDDVLLQHTVEGYNNMPPLGYCMDCERADFVALINFMSSGSRP